MIKKSSQTGIENTRIWRIPKPNTALKDIFSLKLGISKVVAQILINRGINTTEEARKFLSGNLDLLHDPFLMKHMEKAVSRIRRAVAKGEKVRIFGDYDVDGVTSTAILLKALHGIGADTDYYIPQRLTEGYGMNQDAVRAAGRDGVNLIITVDCAISAVAEVGLANSLGIDVIVTDHHEPPAELPEAFAIINPRQVDCTYPFKDLAGAGVAFKLGQSLLEQTDIRELREMTEFLSLGTIADIVPLKNENRVFVKEGLRLLGSTENTGLRALMDECGIDINNVDTRNVAFQIAPRINAAGRLGDAGICVRLLLSQDEEEARALAAELSLLNSKRQRLEAGIYEEALEMIRTTGIDPQKEKVIVLAKEGWHQGVIGIVASKLAKEYYRPVVLLSIEGEIAKGSARSIPSFNIYEAFRACRDYLTRYGGHSQAAGLTIDKENIEGFNEAINRYANLNMTEDDLVPEVFIDSEVELSELDEKLFGQLAMLAPYGCQNPDPVLTLRGAGVLDYRSVGSNGLHLKLRITDTRLVMDGIGFNLAFQSQALKDDKLIDLVFVLEKNEWNGSTSLQLNVKDFRPAQQDAGSSMVPVPEDCTGGKKFLDEMFQNAILYLNDDYYRDIGVKEEFYTKVAGVTFGDRQEKAACLSEGQQMNLVREPDNKHDANAIKIETFTGIQVGYLNARLARHFAPLLDSGEKYNSYVTQVTGGKDRNYGINIIIQKSKEAGGELQQKEFDHKRENLSVLDDEKLLDKVRQALLGELPYRVKQREAIKYLLQGYNTLAIFGTGRGKSAVFQTAAAFKAIRSKEITIIVYPLRALVNDQFESMSVKLEQLGLRVFKGNGSISEMERVRLFTALEMEELDVLLTTPEFILYHMQKLQQMTRKVGLFVVDESHHIGMSSMVHRPIYRRLGELAACLGSPPIMAVTATADQDVAEEIIHTLHVEKVVVDPHIRTNLQIIDKRDCAGKVDYLKQVVSTASKCIIYVNSRLQTVELAAMLRESVPDLNSRIAFYHAGLSSTQRNTIERMFRTGEITAVVSTSAFGEGIDIPDIRHILVFHLNFNLTEFNQQCGRCGRDGEKAQIHLLCGKRDAAINSFIMDTSSPDRDTLAKVFVVLRKLAESSHPIEASNEEIAVRLKEAGIKHVRTSLVSACLGILEELRLIRRELQGRAREIYLEAVPDKKIDLGSSLRFLEGQEEKQAFHEFEECFFKASSGELLSFINRPIYPEKYLDTQISG
ncbi:single-stranded-DNA-specific exonuclease RecJ [Phosphitispora sp. TUW77]|uniref:single-stranded-DNA-specific exonuclease RecJ n=1 Tax=Phosphitispora sp. TUW77 TaxID=3152361 RepID=UPI003AB2D501